MATNTLAGFVTNKAATLLYLSGALGASVTTTIKPVTPASSTDPKTTKELLGRDARGKVIPRFFCKKVSGSSANFAVKVQHAIPLKNVAESGWDWTDLVTFTALNSDVATTEGVEPTVPIKPILRVVVTRTGGTVTGLHVGYEYAQVGPKGSYGSFSGSLS